MSERLKDADGGVLRCVVRWNPGEWPYVTRCILPPHTEGDHIDRKGRSLPNVPGQMEVEGQ